MAFQAPSESVAYGVTLHLLYVLGGTHSVHFRLAPEACSRARLLQCRAVSAFIVPGLDFVNLYERRRLHMLPMLLPLPGVASLGVAV